MQSKIKKIVNIILLGIFVIITLIIFSIKYKKLSYVEVYLYMLYLIAYMIFIAVILLPNS